MCTCVHMCLCVTDSFIVRFLRIVLILCSVLQILKSFGHCEYISLSLGYSSIEVHENIAASSKEMHFPVVLKNQV